MAAADFRENTYRSADGLTLYYRDYNPYANGTAVICLPGLTRNSKDFAALAERLSPSRRVVCPDFRGRGRSAYDPNPDAYAPMTYAQDVLALIQHIGRPRVLLVGTSLGGIVSMLVATHIGAMAAASAAASGAAIHHAKPNPEVAAAAAARAIRERIAGVILNDVGPIVETAAIDRIKSYLGKGGALPSWDQATAALRFILADSYPDLPPEEWRAYAERTFIEKPDGSIVADYDPAIAKKFHEAGAPEPEAMWQLFGSLEPVPTLLVWGMLSDLLVRPTVEEMKRRKSDLEVVEVPNRGHVPLLVEAADYPAVERFVSAHA